MTSDRTLKLPPLPDLDFSRMEGDAFIPPGATVIWPDPRITVDIRLTPKGKYPSTAESIAMNGNVVVGSRSAQEGDHMRHWLRIFRRGDAEAHNILQTENSLETLWSYDSSRLAVSHFIGKNEAEVLVFRVGDEGWARPLVLDEALKPYFSEAQLSSARFNKAYRWSDGAQLIVRGIGRQASEPHDLFGYEMVVDAAHPDDPTHMHLIRGYTKAARPKDGAQASLPP